MADSAMEGMSELVARECEQGRTLVEKKQHQLTENVKKMMMERAI
jgi:hypothetical protein